MIDTKSDPTRWTTAVLGLIELTQSGRLEWQNDVTLGRYIANLGENEFQLTSRDRNEFESSLSSSSPFLVNWQPGPYAPGPKLEVYKHGNLESRFPSVPALDGLLTAVKEYTSLRASNILEAIDDALKVNH